MVTFSYKAVNDAGMRGKSWLFSNPVQYFEVVQFFGAFLQGDQAARALAVKGRDLWREYKGALLCEA